MSEASTVTHVHAQVVPVFLAGEGLSSPLEGALLSSERTGSLPRRERCVGKHHTAVLLPPIVQHTPEMWHW